MMLPAREASNDPTVQLETYVRELCAACVAEEKKDLRTIHTMRALRAPLQEREQIFERYQRQVVGSAPLDNAWAPALSAPRQRGSRRVIASGTRGNCRTFQILVRLIPARVVPFKIVPHLYPIKRRHRAMLQYRDRTRDLHRLSDIFQDLDELRLQRVHGRRARMPAAGRVPRCAPLARPAERAVP